MYTKHIIAAGVLYIGLMSFPATTIHGDSKTGEKGYSAEKHLLAAMGLPDDANDAAIVRQLETPVKRIFACGVIRYRKISSAQPRLLAIVTDHNMTVSDKIAAASALCDLGSREWLKPMKGLLADPNAAMDVPSKMEVAAILARAGDFSQFGFVASHAVDEKEHVRYVAITALGEFSHKSDPVADSAATVLSFVAASDVQPRLRELAIYGMEKIARKRPEVVSKVMDALTANANSPDASLRVMSTTKLKMYKEQPPKK